MSRLLTLPQPCNPYDLEDHTQNVHLYVLHFLFVDSPLDPLLILWECGASPGWRLLSWATL